MENRPSELVEAIVGALVPPACREHVLGDLHERYRSPSGYALDAISVLPRIVAARFRQVCYDAPYVALAQCAIAFVVLWNAVGAPSTVHWGPRFFAAPLAMLLTLLLFDVYAPAAAPGLSFSRAFPRALAEVGIACMVAMVLDRIVTGLTPRDFWSTSAIANRHGEWVFVIAALRAGWRAAAAGETVEFMAYLAVFPLLVGVERAARVLPRLNTLEALVFAMITVAGVKYVVQSRGIRSISRQWEFVAAAPLVVLFVFGDWDPRYAAVAFLVPSTLYWAVRSIGARSEQARVGQLGAPGLS